MKKLMIVALAIFAVAFGNMLLSCSSDDELKNDNKKVENTNWYSAEFNSHQTTSVFTDKNESNTVVLAKMSQLSGLRYATDESSETKDVSVNLCEKEGHSEDGLMSLFFNSDNCLIKITTSKSIYSAKRTITEKKYKFEEGSYTVSVGGNSYEGITVYNYGVYRANGTLFIPLDGNGCITIETTTKYTDKKIDNEVVNEKTVISDYNVSGNVITFSYTENSQSKSMTGTLSSDGQIINLTNNPFMPSIKNFKK